MLDDLLERLLTKCPTYLQEMGYLREVLGIRSRYRRYHDGWESHCRRCRELIVRAAGLCGRKRRAAVLGSGWLHDVPLDDLVSQFEEVVLVDLFHPLAIRNQVRKHRNVRLASADVTGSLEEVWRRAHTPRADLPRPEPRLFLDDNDLDFTVSLNMLSQLPCMPEHYLRQARAHSSEKILAWCRTLVRSHLDYLRRLPGNVCLITDVEVRTVNARGEEVNRETTLFGESFPYQGDIWLWELVQARKEPQHGEQLVVVGVPDIREGHTGDRGVLASG